MKLTAYQGSDATSALDLVLPIYAEVFAEPPYNEGPEDTEQFTNYFQRRTSTGYARVITATINDEPVGFTFGHLLQQDDTWWDGTLTPLPTDATAEPLGRSFAIIELAVRAPHRTHGIGRTLHNQLLTDVATERAVLLVRPEAEPARSAYDTWGYSQICQIRPEPDKPIYDAMVKDLKP